jgi:glutamyl-tRNA reductase
MTDAVPFAVVQFDYRRASTRWRAAMALDEAGRRELHRELCGQGQTGFVQVATCNRTTWIAAGSSAEWLGQLLVGQVVERVGAAFPDEAPPAPEVITGVAAVAYLLRVALGLESLAKGDGQIAGQLRAGFAAARGEGTSCGLLNVLETTIGRAARRAAGLPRSKAQRSGLHTLVVDALRERGVASGARVLVVGLGAIGRRVLAEVRGAGFEGVAVNRSPKPDALRLDEVLSSPPPHAAVVVCTGAAQPVWGEGQLREGVVVVDIGSPAQVGPAARSLLGERAISLDDLARRFATAAAASDPRRLAFVDHGVEDLLRALGRRRARDVLRASHEQYQQLAYTELPALLDRTTLDAGERGRLEEELRGWLRGYARAVLDAVEDLVVEPLESQP